MHEAKSSITEYEKSNSRTSEIIEAAEKKEEIEWVIRMPRGRYSTWGEQSDHEEKKEDNIRIVQNPGHSLPISEALRAARIHTTFIMEMLRDKDWLNYLHTLYLIYS